MRSVFFIDSRPQAGMAAEYSADMRGRALWDRDGGGRASVAWVRAAPAGFLGPRIADGRRGFDGFGMGRWKLLEGRPMRGKATPDGDDLLWIGHGLVGSWPPAAWTIVLAQTGCGSFSALGHHC